MGILSELVWTILYLSCVAIDMAIVLLLFRIVGQWRRIGWVERINDTAKGIVDPLIDTIGRNWPAVTSAPMSQNRALAFGVLTLCLARFVLCGVAGLFLA